MATAIASTVKTEATEGKSDGPSIAGGASEAAAEVESAEASPSAGASTADAKHSHGRTHKHKHKRSSSSSSSTPKTEAKAPDDAALRIQAPKVHAAEATPMDDDGASDGHTNSNSSTRKRRRSEEATTTTTTATPLFLEKTFEMLDRCDGQIAGWSTAGDSFIVRNPGAFAEHVIPVYFKHKNFSSFVRQLNFYGFRKVRVVDPELTGGVDPKDWWEFHHEKFRRGRRELLRDIKRRSVHATVAAATAAGSSAGLQGIPSDAVDISAHANVDRAEMDELRGEVAMLRDQMQEMQRNMSNVIQFVMARSSTTVATPSGPLPPVAVSVPGAVYNQPLVPGLLPQMALSTVPLQVFRADKQSPRTPGFTLRPLQTPGLGNATPGSIPALQPPGMVGISSARPHVGGSWESFSRPSSSDPNAANVPPIVWSRANEHTTNSSGGSTPAAIDLKRANTQQGEMSVTLPSVENPDAAVRHMSMMVAKIRNDLLNCIIARILGFLRIQPAQHGTPSSPEIQAVAGAVLTDIQLKLRQINEAEAVSCGTPGRAQSETTLMYRIEILKFVSKELPRAVQDAVEKRLPTPQKKSLDRSVLALMVQKAQAALETQMRVDNGVSPAHRKGDE